MKEELEKDLQKIGLSEKEAKVYLAGLELGPSTAQTIAAKASVNRPTTYIMIESLIKRGLMSSFQKGKKRFFVSGKPTQLLYLLDAKRKEIDEQETFINTFLHKLTSVGDENSQPPQVVLYEGVEAVKVLQDELLQNSNEVLEIVPFDEVRKFIPPIFSGDIRESFSKKFHIKSIYTRAEGPLNVSKPNVEYKYLPPDKFPIKAEIIIFGNKVVIATFTSKPEYIHISSENIASTMKMIFEILWATPSL